MLELQSLHCVFFTHRSTSYDVVLKQLVMYLTSSPVNPLHCPVHLHIFARVCVFMWKNLTAHLHSEFIYTHTFKYYSGGRNTQSPYLSKNTSTM